MTEGSPPTNFIFAFQSKARKQKTSCVSLIHMVSAVAARQSFFSKLHHNLYIFCHLCGNTFMCQLKLSHIHTNLTGSLKPIQFALKLL